MPVTQAFLSDPLQCPTVEVVEELCLVLGCIAVHESALLTFHPLSGRLPKRKKPLSM